MLMTEIEQTNGTQPRCCRCLAANLIEHDPFERDKRLCGACGRSLRIVDNGTELRTVPWLNVETAGRNARRASRQGR